MTTIHVLLHGDIDEANIVGVFSSAEKATNFLKTTKISAHTECYEFELDPAIPEPYTKGLSPWRVVLQMTNGKVLECKSLNDLGRLFTEEQVALHSPYINPNLIISVAAKEEEEDDGWSMPASNDLTVLCWAADASAARAHAMAIRAQHLSSKAFLPCVLCKAPTNRVVCDATEGMEAMHVDCNHPAWVSEVKRKFEAKLPVIEAATSEPPAADIEPATTIATTGEPEINFIKFGEIIEENTASI